jgi:anion-transporting  ArsA/GET3 family ATPase
VNHEVAGLAKVGPIRSQADSIMKLLRSDRTAVHLVTLLEEMPVQETVDAAEHLAELGLPLGSVVVNMVRRSPLDDDSLALAAKEKLPVREIRKGLAAAGLPADDETVAALTAEARDHAIRVGLERENRRRIDELGRPVAELGLVPDGIDLGAVYDLSEELATTMVTA